MKQLKHYKLILVLIIVGTFINHTSLNAQLTVNNSLTPAQLVQTILLGSGVTASNITYNGVAVAIGDFNGTASNIGLPAGVLLSSGNINNAVGPNNQGGASVGNGRPGDPDLDQIMAPTHSYDAAILEFDFVPTSDTVKFRYVFGSEEYMEFVSPFPGGINDGFGFFISGPGITGTFSNNAKNIAIIPGTALPVTMFHLNLNSNSAFYFDNGNGFGTGTAPNGQTVQYDGFTVVMTAASAVQCGQTYHIKIAIADGGDSALDSGVFLEAGSFSSSGTANVGPDIAVNQGCVKQLTAKNLTASTVTWTSIAPGAQGAYNNYLACTSGCLNNTVTGTAGAPAFVDYKVCGTSTGCNPTTSCDTVRINFNPALNVSVTPQNPVLCGGQNSTTLTANVTGGSVPYQFLWNNVNPSQSITVGSGIYTVEVKDASGCPPVLVTSTITSYSVAPTANAGADINVCSQNPTVMLNGVINGATGGIWSGGNGTFNPSNVNALSGVSYTPTQAEINAGFVDLTLTTTGTGSCAPASDVVRINYFNFTESVNFTVGNVSCFGGNNGSITVNVVGTTTPYTYNWSTVPAQTLPSINNLTAGTYSVTITNGLGCKLTTSANVIQPAPIALASEIQKVACGGGNTGSISITPVGGNGPYTYQWSNGATTSSIFNLTAQTYTVTVSDVSGCSITNNYTVFESSTLSLSLNATNVNCFGGKDGSITSTVNGGTAPYKYSWNTGASSPTLSGVPAGTYTLTVTDASGCIVSANITINEPLTVVSA
ncbi:MAG: choice-of-anchor L domain-containing protein, partial [Bacteroidia bacterium]